MIKQAITTALGMVFYKIIVGFFKKVIPTLLSMYAFLFGLGVDPLEKFKSIFSWVSDQALKPIDFLSQVQSGAISMDLKQVELAHLNDDRLLIIGMAIGVALVIYGLTPSARLHRVHNQFDL